MNKVILLCGLSSMLKSSETVTEKKFISVSVSVLIQECRDTIKKYELSDFLKEKPNFSNLERLEQEKLIMGLIKLGEALTFCRDKNISELQTSGIIPFAINLAKIRNHIVHKQIYFDNYSKLQDLVRKIPSNKQIGDALDELENSKLTELSKEILKGGNNFDFEYNHHLLTLKNELSRLNSFLSQKLTCDMISKNIVLEAYLENRIRNILMIMLDIVDENGANKNKNDDCTLKKEAARVFNENFFKNDLLIFFQTVKNNRDALCHYLDITLSKPYSDTQQMLEFIEDLRKLLTLNYVDNLEQSIESQLVRKTGASTSKQTTSTTFSLFRPSSSQNPTSKKVVGAVFRKKEESTTSELGVQEKANVTSTELPYPEPKKQKTEEVAQSPEKDYNKVLSLVDYDSDSDEDGDERKNVNSPSCP